MRLCMNKTNRIYLEKSDRTVHPTNEFLYFLQHWVTRAPRKALLITLVLHLW